MLHSPPPQPEFRWHEVSHVSRRGGGGSGQFERVLYFDLADGALGRATTQLLQRGGSPTGLSVVKSTGHEIGLEEGRVVTVLVPVAGTILSITETRDLRAEPGQAMILPPGWRRTVTQREGADPFRAIVLSRPTSAFSPALREARVLKLADFDDLAGAVAAARSAMGSTDAGATDALVAAAHDLLEGALQVVVASDPVNRATRAAGETLRRAEAILCERYAEEISIADVAEEIGISPRQLQDMFRRHHGRSPHAFLTRLRLEHAHRDLKGRLPAPNVTDIALLSGFAHLGRFPQTYRGRFGTLPSQARDFA